MSSRAKKLASVKEPTLPKLANTDYLTLHRVKQTCDWFTTWAPWQRRVFVCRVMEHCSRQQLELLATSLEPILHLDFSTSLGPHLQALHLDRAATFHVQRTLVQNILPPLPSTDSWACLDSLTQTTSTVSSSERQSCPVKTKKEYERILPAIPLTHTQHEPGKSIEDIVTMRKHRFGSIPDFRSTANLLKNKHFQGKSKTRHRSRSLEFANVDSLRQAESFKKQLLGMSKWIDDWSDRQRAYLLMKVVKRCDKQLLGYFVQCLHQRLHDSVGVDLLSDDILIRIFSYLNPQSLCRASVTCKRWNRLSTNPSLWKTQCLNMSRREGVNDLSKAVQIASGQPLNVQQVIDWKRTYRDLSTVMYKVKDMVLKAAQTVDGVSTKNGQNSKSPNAKKTYTLTQMLHTLRKRVQGAPAPTTQELLMMAPESPASARKRQRAARLEAYLENEKLQMDRLLSTRYHHRKPRDRSTLATPLSIRRTIPASPLTGQGLLNQQVESWKSGIDETVTLAEAATDTRPSVPSLPNPEGLECLVLSGGLSSRAKPGVVRAIPKVRRLPLFLSPVCCMQCDNKKIVTGTVSREIMVHDIRTGRPVQVLTGHKGSVQCLQYDGFKLVSGSWDTTCIVWDAVNFQLLKELHGHTDCVSCLKFNEDILVTGSYDKSLRVWSTSSWDCVTVIGDAHSAPVLCLALNQWAIASGGADKTVKLWSPSSHELLKSLAHDSPVRCLLLSSALLVTASLDGAAQCWNVATETLVMEMSGTSAGVHMTGLSLSAERLFGSGSDGILYEWNILSGGCARKLTGHSSPLTCVWCGDDKLVTASQDKTVCVWYNKKAIKLEIDTNLVESSVTENIVNKSFYSELPIVVVTDSTV